MRGVGPLVITPGVQCEAQRAERHVLRRAHDEHGAAPRDVEAHLVRVKGRGRGRGRGRARARGRGRSRGRGRFRVIEG